MGLENWDWKIKNENENKKWCAKWDQQWNNL